MKAHMQYLWYVLRHKWFVFVEMFQVWRVNPWALALLWRGLIHDWSKFSRAEWGPYVDFFYRGPWPEQHLGDWRYYLGDKYTKTWVQERFDRAWLHHQHHNPHHWQAWVLREDDGGTKVLEMPEHYVIEMICDWKGAGRALGKPDTAAWYQRNYDNIMLHPQTRRIVDYRLGVAPSWTIDETTGRVGQQS